MGLESLYHQQTGESQGAELTPTFLMHQKVDRPYHIDYVFTSPAVRVNSKLTIGDMAEWLTLSDHMPLLLEWNDG